MMVTGAKAPQSPTDMRLGSLNESTSMPWVIVMENGDPIVITVAALFLNCPQQINFFLGERKVASYPPITSKTDW